MQPVSLNHAQAMEECLAVPSTAAALPRCTATATCCTMKLYDSGSPVCALRRCPRSLRNAVASGPKTPLVSLAIGVKWWLASNSEYFRFFSCSAWEATEPASLEASATWEDIIYYGQIAMVCGGGRWCVIICKLVSWNHLQSYISPQETSWVLQVSPGGLRIPTRMWPDCS